MTKRRKQGDASHRVGWRAEFLRGFIATALVSAVAGENREGRLFSGRVLHNAVKGGVGIATGSTAAYALSRRSYSEGVATLVAGAACMLTIDHVLSPKTGQKEEDHV